MFPNIGMQEATKKDDAWNKFPILPQGMNTQLVSTDPPLPICKEVWPFRGLGAGWAGVLEAQCVQGLGRQMHR